jgi:hypothetical protein
MQFLYILYFQEDKYSPTDEEGEVDEKKEEVIDVEEVCILVSFRYLSINFATTLSTS